MLNADGIRELSYIVKIDSIEPIVGSDNCEAAVVGGWRVMTRKGAFRPGDLAVYFEIDSQVPATEQFAFLAAKHYKVKTQKYTFGGKGNFVSQGLLMSFSDFGWAEDAHVEGDFLTKELGVVYATAEDNARKANSTNDKYKKMAKRMGKKFSKQPYKWLMKREWGRRLLFVFFGKKKDKTSWPVWVVKTDEERVQNMPWILEDKTEWFATEKIDGTSTTFTMKGWGRKREFYICSRNVVFDKPDKKCYYDTNVYLEMAEKYNIESALSFLMEYFENTFSDAKVEFVTLQGETFGAGIQKRDYGRNDHDFRAFNLIVKFKDQEPIRLNPRDMTDLLKEVNIPSVPIVDEHFIMPDTVDELLAITTSTSAEDGKEREGLVFRSYDGQRSFKAVSNEFLLKYHG